MADIRATGRREKQFTLTLSEEEAMGLREMALSRFRRPGDELRAVLNAALIEFRKERRPQNDADDTV